MVIDNAYEYGVITGQIEENQFKRLRQLPEIEDFRLDQDIQLPPPDAKVQ